jgi:hypothetical protein
MYLQALRTQWLQFSTSGPLAKHRAARRPVLLLHVTAELLLLFDQQNGVEFSVDQLVQSY